MKDTNEENEFAPLDSNKELHPFHIPEWMFGDSVEARNALQKSGKVHPYTCGESKCRATLLATEEGWLCPVCGYTQKL